MRDFGSRGLRAEDLPFHVPYTVYLDDVRSYESGGHFCRYLIFYGCVLLL